MLFRSIVILGEKNVLNKIIKNIYEDYSLLFYKTLIKTIVEADNIKLDILSEDDCEFIEESNKYMGYIEISTQIYTDDPTKLLKRLDEDKILINQYLERYNKSLITFRIAISAMFFKQTQYKDLQKLLLVNRSN